MDFSNIPTGLKITSQIPLNVKEFCKDEDTLAYLGVDDNLAFTYHDQLEVLCLAEKSIYIWREVQSGEENTGLIPLDFTYPLGLPEIYNISYSGKTYNFFLKTYINSDNISEYVSTIVGPQGPQGPAGSPGIDGVSLLEDGYSTSILGDGSNEDPYKVNVENLQKTINTFPYTLTSLDDKHTIFIDNGGTNVIVNVPDGLVDNFSTVFIQEGIGSVTVQATGTATLSYPSTTLQNIVKGQYYWAMIEKKLTTDTYYLLGSLLPI